ARTSAGRARARTPLHRRRVARTSDPARGAHGRRGDLVAQAAGFGELSGRSGTGSAVGPQDAGDARGAVLPRAVRARAVVDGPVRAAADAGAAGAAERGATLVLPPATGLFAAADPTLLTTAIRNLLSNAVEHGNERGRIKARVSESPGFVVVEVEDDGPGVP